MKNSWVYILNINSSNYITLYIYIYIKSQNSEKIKLESNFLNFVVNHELLDSNLIFSEFWLLIYIYIYIYRFQPLSSSSFLFFKYNLNCVTVTVFNCIRIYTLSYTLVRMKFNMPFKNTENMWSIEYKTLSRNASNATLVEVILSV